MTLCSHYTTKSNTKVIFLVMSIYLLMPAVTCQECADNVGSLSHDREIVIVDHTFILAGYTVPCSGTVVAWDFCYRTSGATSVTFYPSIWRITKSGGEFTLVHSNTITYNSASSIFDLHPCQIFNLEPSDQFTAPAGSVVGLYSNVQTQLLRTSTDNLITTYQFRGNHSSVNVDEDDDVNYNIAIRVHLAQASPDSTTIPIQSDESTSAISSPSSTVTDTISVASTSSAILTPTTSTLTVVPITMTTVVISPTVTPDDVPVSSTSGSSSVSSAAIIGGVLGGVILVLMIILILCTITFCIRRCHRKGLFPEDNNVSHIITTKLNTDVTMESNPSYGANNKLNNIIKLENLDVPTPFYCAIPAKSRGNDESQSNSTNIADFDHQLSMTEHHYCNSTYNTVAAIPADITNDDARKDDNSQNLADVDQTCNTNNDDNSTYDIPASQQSDNLYI